MAKEGLPVISDRL